LRWRWLEREGLLRALPRLEFNISPEAEDMFQAACQCVVGKGGKINFRSNKWIEGRSLEQIDSNPRKEQWPRDFNIIVGFFMYPKYTSNPAMDFCSEHEAPSMTLKTSS
jgi:hypothetical protein